MPHFIIEINKELQEQITLEDLARNVFDTALASKLFLKHDIKSRVRVFDTSIIGGEKQNFIHVWGYIQQGRSFYQKRELSENIVKSLEELVNHLFVVSCNISELDKNSYFKIQ